jgi:hypothetical protein
MMFASKGKRDAEVLEKIKGSDFIRKCKDGNPTIPATTKMTKFKGPSFTTG